MTNKSEVTITSIIKEMRELARFQNFYLQGGAKTVATSETLLDWADFLERSQSHENE